MLPKINFSGEIDLQSLNFVFIGDYDTFTFGCPFAAAYVTKCKL